MKAISFLVVASILITSQAHALPTTLGNSANPNSTTLGNSANPISTTAVTGGTNPGIVVAPVKLTSLISPKFVNSGQTFIVRLNGKGTGDCKTMIVIDQLIPNNYKSIVSTFQEGKFPRDYQFTLSEVGTYQARIAFEIGGSNCYAGKGTIVGDTSKIKVVSKVAN